MPIYVLCGMTDRDPDEVVCMFFATEADRTEFKEELPGHYLELTIVGADINALEVIR